MHYEIPLTADINLAKTVAKAEKLAARAAKKGMIGGYQVTTRTVTEQRDGSTVEQTYLTITGDTVKIDGWHFLAVARFTDGQPVVTSYPGADLTGIDRAAITENYCDHCHTTRNRNQIILVAHDDGTIKHVGSTCVADFLGHTVAPAWYSDADPFAELAAYAGTGPRTYPADDILAVAIAACAAMGGYHKADSPTPTSWVVRTTLDGPRDNKERKDLDAATGTGWADRINTAHSRVEEALARLPDLGDSDWAHNLRAVLHNGTESHVTDRHLPLAASLAAALARKDAKDAEAAAAPKVTEARYADDGTKVTLTATMTAERGFQTMYGWTNVYVFTADGHRFEWLTKCDIPAQVGDTVTLTGKVKGINEYHGTTTTVLTRCKITT